MMNGAVRVIVPFAGSRATASLMPSRGSLIVRLVCGELSRFVMVSVKLTAGPGAAELVLAVFVSRSPVAMMVTTDSTSDGGVSLEVAVSRFVIVEPTGVAVGTVKGS